MKRQRCQANPDEFSIESLEERKAALGPLRGSISCVYDCDFLFSSSRLLVANHDHRRCAEFAIAELEHDFLEVQALAPEDESDFMYLAAWDGRQVFVFIVDVADLKFKGGWQIPAAPPNNVWFQLFPDWILALRPGPAEDIVQLLDLSAMLEDLPDEIRGGPWLIKLELEDESFGPRFKYQGGLERVLTKRGPHGNVCQFIIHGRFYVNPSWRVSVD
jgi:hypothetical protein